MIPAALRACKGWLLWKLVPVPGKKPLKVPYYVSGGKRSGTQGDPKDRARWATFEDAQRLLDDDLAGEYAGLGFALSPDWGVVGLDFDQCVNEAGDVDVTVMRVVGDTYCEYSPSGTGIHAFLRGSLPDKKSRAEGGAWGFEVFCENGFLTMTGRETPCTELAGIDTLAHVNGAISELFEQRFGANAIHVPRGERTVSATEPLGLTDAQLRHLLYWHDADAPYIGNDLKAGSWMGTGMALHHETNGEGRGLALWIEHSSGGSKYPGAELLEHKWEGFGRRSGAEVTATWLRIVAEARSNGACLDDSAFEDISAQDDRPPVAAQIWDGPGSGGADLTSQTARDATLAADMQLVAKLPPPDVPRVSVKRRGIPEAHYLTTDQANAQRLKNAFGSLVFVAAGKWHVWDGKRWVGDESDVYRYGCRLSDIVREEAKPFRARAAVAEANGDTPEKKRYEAIAEALGKWALKCEMKGTIEAAIGLARKMLTVDSGSLDRDPWALNCENGTVDLRTGALRRHDPADYITRLVPVRYDPSARCPTWERVVGEIACEDQCGSGVGVRPLVEFLQRWFGYCLTAHTREQCFVVHWGGGSNGKSTILDLMAETMGDYAGTAAPGLLAATKGDRHPTEIAALFGRRMVTAHESGEGVVLREDFIKQATGGDMLTARHMREDFFTFAPTHKIQLLTNHKPQVKGQDEGIWRRVMLVPYLASFGSDEEVLCGRRTHVKDAEMPMRLRGEVEGILAWRVRGAVEWAAGGLQPPRVVTAASEAYRSEQDRVGRFVEECCETGADFEEPLTEGMGGLYPAFQSWCKDGGIFAMSKLRFADEVLRVVPGGQIGDRRHRIEGGKQRKVKMISGVRLLPD